MTAPAETRCGLAIGISRRESLRSIAEFAAEAESLGFSSLWVQDNPLTTKDPYAALAIVAAATTRLRLGPGVSTAAIRHPAVIANAILTLNDESEGRAFLGLGSGGPSLVAPLGMSSRRAKAFRSELQQISTLLRGEEVTTETAHYSLGYHEAQAVPIIAAASGDMMLNVAGALADGVLLAGPAVLSRYRAHAERARKAAEDAGHDPSSLSVRILVNMGVDTESARGLDQMKPFVASWVHAGHLVAGATVPSEFASVIDAIKDRHDPARHLSAGADSELVPDELVRLVAIAGSPAECRERLREVLSLEPEEIVITVPARNRLDSLQSLAAVTKDLD